MKKIIIVIIIVTLVFGGWWLFSQQTDSENFVDKPVNEEIEEESTSGKGANYTGEKGGETFEIGETAEVDEFEITVNGARFDSGTEGMSPDEGEEWIVVDGSIRNTSDEPAIVSAMMMFSLFDDNDKAIGSALGAEISKSLDGEIKPGEKISGELAFSVSEGSKSYKFVFCPGTLGIDDQVKYEFDRSEVEEDVK